MYKEKTKPGLFFMQAALSINDSAIDLLSIFLSSINAYARQEALDLPVYP